jgi:surface antigen
VAGSVTGRAFRQSSYHRRLKTRLWGEGLARIAALSLALASGGLTGACSYPIGSLFGKDDDKAELTGSVAPTPVSLTPAENPPENDLVYARAAASEVLAKGGKDTSAPWENPRTGARGTVTPLATAYTQSGQTCRDFLASYVHDGAEAWMQGEACQQQKGRWEIRSLKPWKRS